MLSVMGVSEWVATWLAAWLAIQLPLGMILGRYLGRAAALSMPELAISEAADRKIGWHDLLQGTVVSSRPAALTAR
jgi:hypothetical protein